jgi:hypothetical protein
LKGGYFASSALFAVCVGPASDGKTPALKVVAIAVRRIDDRLHEEYQQTKEAWEEEVARAKRDQKNEKPPPAPKPRRIDIDEATMESLPGLLVDNPRGLVMIRDEMTAFILGMNQYKSGGKGSDRAITLKLWSGDTVTVDRVRHENHEPVRCPHPCLSIVGGLVPDALETLFDPRGRADGLPDRFLWTYPNSRPVPDWSDKAISSEVVDAWCELVDRLWTRDMDSSGEREVPHVTRFTPEGKSAWVELHDVHVALMNDTDFPPSLRGPWGKLREYAGRLALVLACLHHASDPLADPNSVPEVGPRIVKDAWRLISYFRSHAKRVHAVVSDGPGIGGGSVVRAIVHWLRKGNRSSFSERDVSQSRRWMTPDELEKALAHLVARHAIRPREAPSDTRAPGRPATAVYDVNPALLATQNTQNPQNGMGCVLPAGV